MKANLALPSPAASIFCSTPPKPSYTSTLTTPWMLAKPHTTLFFYSTLSTCLMRFLATPRDKPLNKQAISTPCCHILT
jgi:hypothetical protein